MTARAAGQTVAGKFLLKELVARGGMGSVWVAQHLGLKTDIAVKFIDSAAAKRGNALARFEQEAKAAAAIKSPHVVSVLDYGKDEQGHPYLAMELLNGVELGRRLERGDTLSLDEAKALVFQTCKALTRAHALGFVHRDLKPENLFLCADEEPFTVKILDFGLAKDESSELQLTGGDELLGTPDFMSPEQARGRPVDFRTDLYSLGVLVFKCLTGRLPYEKTAPLPELLISITQREPALASVYRSDLPAAVVTWVSRALQKEPAQRFASAKEMADAFVDACASRRMVVAVPRVSVSDEDAHPEEHTARSPAVMGEDLTLRPPQVDPAFGEEATMRGEQEKPALPPLERDRPPPSRARAEPAPPSGFKVDKTLPLDADPAAFAAARAVPPKKDASAPIERPPSESLSLRPPPPRTNMPMTVVLAIVILVLAVATIVWWRFHANAQLPVQ